MNHLDEGVVESIESLEREGGLKPLNSWQSGLIVRKRGPFGMTVEYSDSEGRQMIFGILRFREPSDSAPDDKYSPRNVGAVIRIQRELWNGPHPNVIPYDISFLERPMPVLAIFPEANIVFDPPPFHSFDDRVRAAKQVTAAVRHIHALNQVHGSLHNGNILFDDHGDAHVVHVGTYRLYDDSPVNVYQSHWRWMAHELLLPNVQSGQVGLPNRESDVYSMGMVLRWIFTGQRPFENTVHETQVVCKMVHIAHAAHDMLLQDELRADVKGIIGDCISHDPGQRPTAGKIMERIKALV